MWESCLVFGESWVLSVRELLAADRTFTALAFHLPSLQLEVTGPGRLLVQRYGRYGLSFCYQDSLLTSIRPIIAGGIDSRNPTLESSCRFKSINPLPC
jgi:hypothetical protein